MRTPLLLLLLAPSMSTVGAQQNVTLLKQFAPPFRATHRPPGVTADAPFSRAWGHTDPATDREIAVACASNGILFVDATPPAHSQDTLTNATFESWFFTDNRPSQWRGAVSFLDHVYAVSIFHPGIWRFRVDTQPSLDVTDLGCSNTTDLLGGGPRIAVDPEAGHLYVCTAFDPLGSLFLHVYDVFDEASETHIDPPRLIAVWPEPVFDVEIQGDRAYFAETPNKWRIVDISGLRSSPPSNPYLWQPPWTLWFNSQPATLSHNSYVPPGGTIMYTTDESPGYLTGRNLGASPPPLNNTTMAEPPIIGRYSRAEPVHSIDGIGHTGYLAHFSAGFHLLDLSRHPGPNANYPLLAHYDTSPLQSGNPGPGAWTAYPHQESGVVYVTDRNEGLFLLRVDAGHVNRYGPKPANVSVPRITAEARPPRIGSFFELQARGMQSASVGVFALSVAEDPNYLAGNPTRIGQATLLLDLTVPAFVEVIFASALGDWSKLIPIPPDPNLVGLKIFTQIFEVTGTGIVSSQGTWFGLGS